MITKDGVDECKKCIVSVGRSGSKWMEKVCENLDITTKSNRVDIGVRVELPAVIFSHLTDELYESKIVYRTEKFEDKVRTFCMNPNGIVVNENTNGIVTVNGHSYEDPKKQTENTNFALLVAKHFSEPFKDSNGYGESIARLSNMLGGGVIVQRFGDLVRGRRSNQKRIEEGLVTPTLSFDERGHRKNDVTYFVCGFDGNGEPPKDFYPVVEDYIGEGGNFERPEAVVKNLEGVKAGCSFAGCGRTLGYL